MTVKLIFTASPPSTRLRRKSKDQSSGNHDNVSEWSEVYSIQHYVVNFVSDMRQVGVFLRILRFPPPIKIDCHNIAEILLKVVLITITLAQILVCHPGPVTIH
jgi:hypothetical protein